MPSNTVDIRRGGTDHCSETAVSLLDYFSFILPLLTAFHVSVSIDHTRGSFSLHPFTIVRIEDKGITLLPAPTRLEEGGFVLYDEHGLIDVLMRLGEPGSHAVMQADIIQNI